MTQEEYLKERVEDQIGWYEKKSATNKTYYMWVNGLIIFFAALIPFVAGLRSGSQSVTLNYIIAVLGVLTATFTGLSALLKFQEKWTTYRVTAEALQREAILFKTATAPYEAGSESFKLFVSNIESVLSSENSNWNQMINKKEDKAGVGKKA